MLSALNTIIKTWEEQFLKDWKQLPIKVKDFWWRWFSQLVTNNLRGILAEYIVASDIGVTNAPREERDAYDLITPEKISIEVKSASYIQSREQKKLSSISFSIRSTHGYDVETNKRDQNMKRQSDVYVFCLLSHQDQATLNPLDMNQRDFYVVPTALLEKEVPWQKTIRLQRLQKLWATKVEYGEIYKTIKSLFT